MALTYRLGKEGVLYYKTTSGGSYVANPDVIDASLSGEKAKADLSTRGTGGWRAQVGTLKDGTITGQMLFNPSSAHVTAFKDAFMDDTSLFIKFSDTADGGTPTPQPFEAEMLVTNFSVSQNLEEGQVVDFELVVAPGTTPTW